jgi:hypothetical protein
MLGIIGRYVKDFIKNFDHKLIIISLYLALTQKHL